MTNRRRNREAPFMVPKPQAPPPLWIFVMRARNTQRVSRSTAVSSVDGVWHIPTTWQRSAVWLFSGFSYDSPRKPRWRTK
eukprot:1231909-Prymnesium_polylepis.1